MCENLDRFDGINRNLVKKKQVKQNSDCQKIMFKML